MHHEQAVPGAIKRLSVGVRGVRGAFGAHWDGAGYDDALTFCRRPLVHVVWVEKRVPVLRQLVTVAAAEVKARRRVGLEEVLPEVDGFAQPTKLEERSCV